MIVIKLMGGLGNQMFQYSFGRKISILKDINLKLDISFFKEQKLRKFELNNFKLNFEIASRKEIDEFKNVSRLIHFIPDKVKIFIENYIPLKFRKYLKERNFFLEKKVSGLSANVYLEGFWQSEKYFRDIRNILIEDFSPLLPIDEYNRKYIELISDVDSISVHIRRGDYVLNPETLNYHGICDIKYYDSAISYFLKNVKRPHFFIFSDDIEWAKKNIIINSPVKYIENNYSNNKNYMDLILMKNCKHNIIANSSFSWWGAWLNTNPDKIVTAPKKWFNAPNIDTKDLIPESWIKI